MPDMVEVPIPIEAGAVAAPADERTRAAMGRLVSRMLRPRQGPTEFASSIADAKAEAREGGLADGDIDAELEAYNAERRGPPAP